MSNKEGKRAGELIQKAEADTNVYKSMEVGTALAENSIKEIWKCIDNYREKIQEPVFTVVMLQADDCLLESRVMRLKFYAYPFLPKPRPRQSVFLYRKSTDDIEFLWTLPEPHALSELSEMVVVDKKFQRMKMWCDAFYKGNFFETIRKQNNIDLESESEYLSENRAELTKACKNYSGSSSSDTLDFGKLLAQ